jgi:protocatechuate 3,4-dioxygenase beta subunit
MRSSTSFVSLLGSALLASASCAPHESAQQKAEAAVAEEPPPRAINFPSVPIPVHLDRRAEPPASVTGTVRDLSDEPLAGAHVCAWNIDPQAADRAPRCVQTDASGAYELVGLVPSHHEVHASAREHQPVGHSESLVLGPEERRDGVDLRVAPGGVLVHGVVRDTRGRPIAGAWVTNFDAAPQARTPRIGGAAATQTDAEGRYALWLTRGPQSLAAYAEGFARRPAREAAAPGRYALDLPAESSLIGQVVDEKGAAVAGARVSALAAETSERAGVAYTDGEGRYRISGLNPGLYRASAEAPGRRGDGAHAVYLGPAATSSPREIRVRPAASVSGRLVVADGQQTCARGKVTLHGQDAGTRVELAGPGGEVYFAALPQGSYGVTAECPGAVAPPEFPGLEIGEQPVHDIAWESAVGRTIRGALVDASGLPLVGVRARAYATREHCDEACRQQNRRHLNGRSTCQTDDQCAMDEICDNGNCVFAGVTTHAAWTSPPSDAHGQFVIAGVPPGKYDVSALNTGQPDPTPAQVTLAERDAEALRLTAVGGHRLEGLVVDARGAPVAHVHVTVLVDRGLTLSPVASVQTDDDGRFALHDLGPGDYRARARAFKVRDGEDTSVPQPGDVRTRLGTSAPGELRLTLPGALVELRGQVQGPGGEPVSGVVVNARRTLPGEDPAEIRNMLRVVADRTTHTDADGAFVLRSLAPGAYTLQAHAGSGVVEVFRDDVRRDERVTLTLPATASIAGELVGPVLPETFTLRVQAQNSDVTRVDTFDRTGGRWTFEGLPAGTYELHCEDNERLGALVVKLDGGALIGLQLPLVLSGGLRGRAIDAELRTPLAGIQVTVSPAHQVFHYPSWATETYTDNDGQFGFIGLPPGRTRVRFPAYEPGALEMTVEPEQTIEVSPTLRLAPDRRGR